jgi:hypothetical protein
MIRSAFCTPLKWLSYSLLWTAVWIIRSLVSVQNYIFSVC